jgi:hypothetical protein
MNKKRLVTSSNASKRTRHVAARRRLLKTDNVHDDNDSNNNDGVNDDVDDHDDDDDDDDDNDSNSTDDDDDGEPMDFERAFGSNADVPKLEHMDIYQNNGNFEDLHAIEGETFFDLQTKIDLKTYVQPVLLSSTINLNPLAAVCSC